MPNPTPQIQPPLWPIWIPWLIAAGALLSAHEIARMAGQSVGLL
jgi:hypothetical protein